MTFKTGDLVQIDTISDAPFREVLGVNGLYILIDFGVWKGWVTGEAYKHILSRRDVQHINR